MTDFAPVAGTVPPGAGAVGVVKKSSSLFFFDLTRFAFFGVLSLVGLSLTARALGIGFSDFAPFSALLGVMNGSGSIANALKAKAQTQKIESDVRVNFIEP
jgi:hypothetical protein